MFNIICYVIKNQIGPLQKIKPDHHSRKQTSHTKIPIEIQQLFICQHTPQKFIPRTIQEKTIKTQRFSRLKYMYHSNSFLENNKKDILDSLNSLEMQYESMRTHLRCLKRTHSMKESIKIKGIPLGTINLTDNNH